MFQIKCCKGCTDRWMRDGARCHDFCEKYQAEVADRNEARTAAIRKAESYGYYKRVLTDKKDVKAKHRRRRAGSTKYM